MYNAEISAMSDTSLTTTADSDDDENVYVPSLRSLLREYEKARWAPTASITAKAAILGYLETGGINGFYAKFRDLFFRLLDFIGVPKKVLVDSMIPKI